MWWKCRSITVSFFFPELSGFFRVVHCAVNCSPCNFFSPISDYTCLRRYCNTFNGKCYREMWLSILEHISNNHRWDYCQVYHKCGHPRLSRKKIKETAWLKKDTPAFEALKEVVTEKRLLAALPHLTEFCHTGHLEVFHNVVLKYCPKRLHFPYDGMKTRLMIAALQWNLQHAQDQPEVSVHYDVVYSKRRKTWVVRKRSERFPLLHVEPLMTRVMEVFQRKIALPPVCRPADLPNHVAKKPKPSFEDAFASFTSRFDSQPN